jgi:hypothetical protein
MLRSSFTLAALLSLAAWGAGCAANTDPTGGASTEPNDGTSSAKADYEAWKASKSGATLTAESFGTFSIDVSSDGRTLNGYGFTAGGWAAVYRWDPYGTGDYVQLPSVQASKGGVDWTGHWVWAGLWGQSEVSECSPPLHPEVAHNQMFYKATDLTTHKSVYYMHTCP